MAKFSVSFVLQVGDKKRTENVGAEYFVILGPDCQAHDIIG